MLSHVQLFATPWTVAHWAPLSMDFPGKNTGVGCHALLQRIFSTQGSNLCLLHCRQILYHLSHQGSPLWPAKGLLLQGHLSLHKESGVQKSCLDCKKNSLVVAFWTWTCEWVDRLKHESVLGPQRLHSSAGAVFCWQGDQGKARSAAEGPNQGWRLCWPVKQRTKLLCPSAVSTATGCGP